MTIYEVLQSTKLPCAYSHFRNDQDQTPPYIVYIGNGQDQFKADDTRYYHNNLYQIEYYFTQKDESNESAIEQALLENGYLFDKSEDVYIESEDVFVIYYYTF